MEFKSLISFYIDMKLRKSGLIHNRNKVRVPDDEKDILQAALSICAQMEHDDRFADVLTSFRKFGITKETFLTVLDQLLVGDLNWARVLSVVSLSGELAVQCMENNEEHKIDFIQDWASSFAEVKLEHWIETHGGMKELLKYKSEPERPVNNWETKLVAAGVIGVAVGLFVASKA